MSRRKVPANVWKRQLERYGGLLPVVVEAVHRETAKFVRTRVARNTPKDTGRAQASWNLSVGTPNYRTKPEDYNNPSGAWAEGEVDLAGYTRGSKIFISNGLPYIATLNAGSSRQAPAGFIEATIQQYRMFLPGLVGDIRARYGV